MRKILISLAPLLLAFQAYGSLLPIPVPEEKKVRVFVVTDAKNEADDQFAIVHALLSPKLEVKGIISSQFENTSLQMGRPAGSMKAGLIEINHILSLMDMSEDVAVYRGLDLALESANGIENEAARAIITEAKKDDPRPLFVISFGPLTDMANALLLAPEIGEKVTSVWIGGGDYPKGGWEYNLSNDPVAANAVFASNVTNWQIPRAVYTTMRTSLAELTVKVAPYGKIGEYLVQQMHEFNAWASARFPDINWPKGESWSLGDTPAVTVLLDEHEYGYREQSGIQFAKESFEYEQHDELKSFRVYTFVDPRFTLEDMFSKIQLFDQLDKQSRK